MREVSFEEIRAFLFGAVETEINEWGLSAHRFTAKQRAIWSSLNDFMGGGARCTTGVRLDFHTDADKVRFTVGGEDLRELNSEKNFKFEVLIDGLLSDCVITEQGEVAVQLPEGEHRLTFAFPSHVRGYLRRMEIAKGATLTPHVYKQKILLLGDSITQGWHSRFDTLSYAWRAALALDADFLCHGVGGSYFYPADFDGMGFAPDLVTVAYGCNDYSTAQSEEELRNNMAAFLTPLLAAFPDARKVGILPIPRLSQSGEKPLGTFANCRRIIREEYAARNLEIIDGYELVPPLGELYTDHLHPNDIGFSLYAENLLKKL